MSILNIINELAADNSRLTKEAILKREIKNVDLINVLKATYDPFINYWIVKIPEYKKEKGAALDLRAALNQLKPLISRKVTGNAAIEHLAKTLSLCDNDGAEVIKRIIQRDLKCGIGVPTINKIWPGLIPTFDVCLAHKDISHIKYPAFAQVKFDGGRCHMVFDGSTVTAYSRNGKIIEFLGVFDRMAKKLMKEGEVWDGEVVFRKDHYSKKFLDRKASNGLFNKGVKGTINEDEAECATFIAWDIVDFSGTISYEDRYNEYIKRWDSLTKEEKESSNIWVAESDVVNNEDEAQAFYDKATRHGHEGAMLKNKDFKWEAKRVKGVGKMKAEEEADLICIGWELGTGKNKNKLGNLICETADHKLRVNVGSGFTDEDREKTPDYFLDKIITVRYNQLIKSKEDNKPWTLFLPRFIERRLDKDVANSFGDLK